MMRWCAYCQQFLGEKPPFDKLEMTHGICDKCKESEINRKPSELQKLKPILNFYQRLKTAARQGDRTQLQELASESKSLNIEPLDFCVGILQPILVEMGNSFVAGTTTAAQEHAFTMMADKLVSEMFQMVEPKVEADSNKTDVLLTCNNGNYHWLGLKLVQMALQQESINVELCIPSLPNQEIIDRTIQLQPQVLGISIYNSHDLSVAEQVRQGLVAKVGEENTPRIAIGGNAAREYLEKIGLSESETNSISYFRDAIVFVNFIKSLVSQNHQVVA